MVVIVSPPLASSAYLSRDFAAGSNSYCGGDREALADGRRGVARAPKQSVSARTISGPPALSEMGLQASMMRPTIASFNTNSLLVWASQASTCLAALQSRTRRTQMQGNARGDACSYAACSHECRAASKTFGL